MSAYLPHTPRLRTLLSTADATGLAAAIWVAHKVRFSPELEAMGWRLLRDHPGLLVWMFLSGWTLALAAELYEPEVLHRRRESVIRVLVMVAGWAGTLALATYLHPSWAYGRGLLALTAFSWALALIVSRWLIRSWLRRRSRFPALVVGDPPTVAQFCRELAHRPSSPWTPVDGSHLGLANIPGEIHRSGASIVVLAGDERHAVEMGGELTALHFSGVPVVAASEIWAWLEERLPLDALNPSIFLHQPGFGAVHWTLFNRLTRIADVVLASLILIVSAPISIVAALLVLTTSGPPVLFRQVRVGQFGRHFVMLKLRTMELDAEATGPVFARPKDPRSTPVGRVLRRFRIDELPQLVNVLRGEMSLVGPRPERPEFIAELTKKIPYYSFRLAVPPGLSGWAQVNTSYAHSLEDHRRKLEFDLYFIRERSIRLYLLTLLRTLSAAIAGTRRS